MLWSVSQFGPPAAEVIVVNNGSTDDTALIAEIYGAKVISVASQLFPGLARNLVAAHTNADLLPHDLSDCGSS